jgi:hypothetical protein
MNLRNALPEFLDEVESLLLRLNRTDLSSQLRSLEIVERCRCGEVGCGSFRVSGASSPDTFEIARPRRSTYARSIDLNSEKGKIILALDQLGRITAFDVRNRPDLRKKLDLLFYYRRR